MLCHTATIHIARQKRSVPTVLLLRVSATAAPGAGAAAAPVQPVWGSGIFYPSLGQVLRGDISPDERAALFTGIGAMDAGTSFEIESQGYLN